MERTSRAVKGRRAAQDHRPHKRPDQASSRRRVRRTRDPTPAPHVGVQTKGQKSRLTSRCFWRPIHSWAGRPADFVNELRSTNATPDVEAGLEVEYAQVSIGFRWAGRDAMRSRVREPPNSSTTPRLKSSSPTNGDEALLKAKQDPSSTARYRLSNWALLTLLCENALSIRLTVVQYDGRRVLPRSREDSPREASDQPADTRSVAVRVAKGGIDGRAAPTPREDYLYTLASDFRLRRGLEVSIEPAAPTLFDLCAERPPHQIASYGREMRRWLRT
jgi:hypothetical protein